MKISVIKLGVICDFGCAFATADSVYVQTQNCLSSKVNQSQNHYLCMRFFVCLFMNVIDFVIKISVTVHPNQGAVAKLG